MNAFIVLVMVGILSGHNFKGTSSRRHVVETTPKLQMEHDFVRVPISDNDSYVVHNEEDIDQLVHAEDDTSIADALAKKIRVLCWVLTYPANHMKKAIHIKETWGKRCNKLLFMSSQKDPRVPTIKLPVKESGKYSWVKLVEVFRYIYQHHLYDADWFLHADDNTYVIVENLRYMLVDHNTSDPIYFGSEIKSLLNQPNYRSKGLMSCGAGLVMSREAVVSFMKEVLQVPTPCRGGSSDWGDERIAQCLMHAGMNAMDSRDLFQRGRMFPFTPNRHINPKVDNDWYWPNYNYRVKTGRDCCSEYAVSFHCVEPSVMYALEFFVYHLRNVGVKYDFRINASLS